jgi:predicted nucleic acid-binding protein
MQFNYNLGGMLIAIFAIAFLSIVYIVTRWIIRAFTSLKKLRKSGITVRKTIDVIIATFCIENRFELIHNDRDFDPMEEYLGLRVKK